MSMNVFGKANFRHGLRASQPARPRGPSIVPHEAPVAADGYLPHGSALGGSAPQGTAERQSEPAGLAPGQPAVVPRPLGGRTKRLADVVIALTALVLAAPAMLAIAVLVRATSGGPAIFAHNRVGFMGQQFRCYKFRTMAADADRMLSEHLARDPEAAREWEETRKLRHDPRITWVGRILRKSSLDELPQLINVLRGEMSCVGPRPIVHDELKHYGPCAEEYLRTRPGLTGPWQVNGRSATDYSSRVSLDSHYVRNWSLATDFGILVRTAFALMRFNEAC